MNELEIKNIRAKLGMTQKQFAEHIGVSINTVQNWEAGGVIPKSKYPILRGVIAKSQTYYGGEESKSSGDKLPLIPIDAVAGFPAIDNGGVRLSDCDFYNIPEFAARGAQFLIRVSGDSMLPKYNNGDILACRKVDKITFFQWGKVYVLDTNQGALVKRLFEDTENPENIICHSDNSDNYPNFTLPKDEIRSLSIVIGVIRLD